jgi:hypothetical protein
MIAILQQFPAVGHPVLIQELANIEQSAAPKFPYFPRNWQKTTNENFYVEMIVVIR